MLSRPKSVANHGTPAMMNAPLLSLRAMIEVRSTPACRIMVANSLLLAEMTAQSLRNSESSDCRCSKRLEEGGRPIHRNGGVGWRFTAGRDAAFRAGVFARLESYHEHGMLIVNLVGRNQADFGRTHRVVETMIAKLDPAGVNGGIASRRGACGEAAHLEDVGEITA